MKNNEVSTKVDTFTCIVDVAINQGVDMKGKIFLNKSMRMLIITSLVLGISACGGGSSDNSDNNEQTTTDTEAPTISITGSNEITITVGDNYSDAGATAEDNLDEEITITTSGTVDTSSVGSYTITYNASDAAGNNANEVTRTVIVEVAESNTPVADTTAPIITLTGASEITITEGDNYSDAGATASDNIDQTIIITTSGSVDNTAAGSYVLTYNATDVAGNNANPVTRTINVTAASVPVVVLPPASIKGVFEDSRVIGLNFETPTQSGITNSQGEFECLPGETVNFSLADIPLGSSLCADLISTFDIGDSLDTDPTTGEYTNINLAVLLQSLDNNQNPADGFIDLTGIVANTTTGITLADIQDGVTQAELDTITGEVDKVSLVTPAEAVLHATISSNKAIVEEDGVLKLNTILTQKDIDAGNYRVQNRVGIELDAPETTTSNPTFSVESDLTVLSQQDIDQSRLRNSLTIIDSTNQYYLGLGISYRNGSYGVNYYVERYGQSGYIEFTSQLLPAFNDVVIEENKTYNFKLELNIDADLVSAYIDGVKVITWSNIFGDESTVNAPQDDTTILQAFSETRAQSIIDPLTGAGTTAGTSIIASVDNLLVQLDGQNILTDDFNDNNYSNPNINYTERVLRKGSVAPIEPTFETLGSNPSALISPNGDEALTWGETESIVWDNTQITGDSVDLYVLYNTSNINNFSTSTDIISNINSYKFGDAVSNTGNYEVDPASFNISGNGFLILIVSTSDPEIWDVSDQSFDIIFTFVPPTIPTFETLGSSPTALITPSGGEVWTWGEAESVVWDNNAIIGDTVDLYILYDDASNLNDYTTSADLLSNKNWFKFGDTIANTGSYSIDPVDLNGTGSGYVVLIISDTGGWDVSDNMFTLQIPPLTTELLNQNSWYDTDYQGVCYSKNTFNNDGTGVSESGDSNGGFSAIPFTYVIDNRSNMTVEYSINNQIESINYELSSLNDFSLQYRRTDANGTQDIVSYSTYAAAIDNALSFNASSACVVAIPE